MLYPLGKALLFQLEPEQAHAVVMEGLQGLQKLGVRRLAPGPLPGEGKTVAGIAFPNAVGLAAGFDKDARYLDALALLGFGFVEIGTVTPRPQAGNASPRLFRLPADGALLNRMGFNNQGVDVAAERLKHRPKNLVVGGNIGKNKDTPNEKAVEDYLYGFRALFGVVDYFTVNVSSPNTPGLRALQGRQELTELLQTLQTENERHAAPKPIFVKIAPDLSDAQVREAAEVALQTGIAGMVATNTTLSRENLRTLPAQVNAMGMGGLSGLPLASRADAVMRILKDFAGNRLALMGVGGIHSGADAVQRMAAGADAVQLYTGFVYEGPGLVSAIRRALVLQGAQV